jgi:hypothetical protein
MKSRVFLASLLAGAMSMCALTAGEQPSKSDDPRRANKVSDEKTEGPVAGLADRCQKMLDMQITVYEGTKALQKAIEATADKKPRPKDKQVALKLSDNEKEIIVEATNAIERVKADGSAVAFSEVFQALGEDMKRVHRHLENSDVGLATLTLEEDIIDALKEMIAGLKKG